ncbi:MAG: type II toxin-antitoxin system prevent-host-death family antitoxin [Rhizobiaceae bacterium]
MRNFSLTELSRGSGAIVDAAFAGPVTLTKHGKAKLVMLPAELYEELTQRTVNPRIARYTNETPEEEAALLLKALDDAIGAAEAKRND